MTINGNNEKLMGIMENSRNHWKSPNTEATLSEKAKVPSFLTKRLAKHNNNKNETVLHDHAASRLVKKLNVPRRRREKMVSLGLP